MALTRGMSVSGDNVIAACLVGAVVVVVGYASGLGVNATTANSTTSTTPPAAAGGSPPPVGVQPAEIPPPPPGLLPPLAAPAGPPSATGALPPASETNAPTAEPTHPGGHHPEQPDTPPPTTEPGDPGEPDGDQPADCDNGAVWTVLDTESIDGIALMTAMLDGRVAVGSTPPLYDDEGRGPLTQTYDTLLLRCEGEDAPPEEPPASSSAPHDEHGGS